MLSLSVGALSALSTKWSLNAVNLCDAEYRLANRRYELAFCSICAYCLWVLAAIVFPCLLNFYPFIWVANVFQRLHHSVILLISVGHCRYLQSAMCIPHSTYSLEPNLMLVGMCFIPWRMAMWMWIVYAHLLFHFAFMLVGSSRQIREYACINTRTKPIVWCYRTHTPPAVRILFIFRTTADANKLFTTDLTQKYPMRTTYRVVMSSAVQ